MRNNTVEAPATDVAYEVSGLLAANHKSSVITDAERILSHLAAAKAALALNATERFFAS